MQLDGWRHVLYGKDKLIHTHTHLVGLNGVHIVVLPQHLQHFHTAILCSQGECPVP